ncbi:unnamed protein product [Prorocentrum cordatum]|uniref:Ion transport domain-containing protein n=1 Tax=Prorocentrum cordatum TaxID=2364126 RepID=A0ABN9XU08_9DINO|nr:unnamed protein product [Polarella glacialis]
MSDKGQPEKLARFADTMDRQPEPITFAEAMVQLQTAHFREVDSLRKELQKMSRRNARVSTKQAQVEEAAARGAADVRGSQGSHQVAVPGAVEEATARGAADALGSQGSDQVAVPGATDSFPASESIGLAAGQAVEGWKGKQGSNREPEIELERDSVDYFDDPFVVRERSVTKDSGIVWNPFADGQNEVSRFMNRFFTSGHSRKKRRAYKIVKSWPFEFISYSAIVANSLFIGISMQLQMDRVQTGSPTEKWPEVIEVFFAVFFTFELLFKVLAEDVYVFFGGDWHWNVLDLILVSAALLQLVIESMYGSETPNLTVSRTIRLFRVTRVLRVVKVVQICQSLRVMIFSIFKSLDALGWVLVVLMFFKYIFAMIFMHGTISYFEMHLQGGGIDLSLEEEQFWDDSEAHIDYMKCSWSSVDRALLTLFESITGGRDWGEVFISLEKIGPVYGICFLVYESPSASFQPST